MSGTRGLLPALLFALLLAGPGGSLFSLDLAYGGGGSLNFSPVRFSGIYDGTDSQVTSQVSATALQFFDLTYAEIQIGYRLNRASTEPTTASTTTKFAAVLTGVSFGAALKYPISLGPVIVFPLVGVEYVLNLSYTDDKDNNLRSGMDSSASALNLFWLKAGIGVDILLGKFFLRPVVTAGFSPSSHGTLTSTHSTGTLALDMASYTIDVGFLFGYRF